ncbi:MAG: glucose/sorbosone dehydrogenase [Pyrinomonadaceae bacterium]|nr:glucose/sorbosone dehydrogenase [Pyrinomonadaceae bacterium]
MKKYIERLKYTLILSLLIPAIDAFAQTALVSQTVQLKNGKTFDLKIHRDFAIIPAAEGLKRVRFFAKSPDGRIFVTDMFNLTDNKKGKVYILDNFDKTTGKFGKINTYMSGLRNPNSVAFYTDEIGQDWFYLAETDKLTRRRFRKGETEPTDKQPEVLAKFPAYGLSYKYGGWHLTRTIVFGNNGKLYVSVGSSCNACNEKRSEPFRATILEMNPDGAKRTIYARGMRNAVGMLWLGRYLFVTNHGSDHLGLNKPDDTFYAVRRGKDYGWARCYQYRGRIYRDRFIPSRRGCRGVPRSYSYFKAHSSAMGFDYFDSDTSSGFIKNSFLIALHGSTDKSLKRGYKVVVVRKGKRHKDLITGFLNGKTVFGRPLDIFKLSPDSFLLSDDHGGVVYLVRKKR